MRILCTGDWHFNAGYDDDIVRSVGEIIAYVQDNPVDLVAIAGDVYDRASEPNSRNLAAHYIQVLADKTQVLVVRGNHDAPGDLKILSELRTRNGIVVDEVPHSRGYGEGVVVHSMPWLTKSRWQALHPDASKEEGDKTVSQLALQFLRNRVALHPGQNHILVGHMTVAGAKAQNHQQMGADGITVGLYDLPEAGFYAACLGHIHLQQQLGWNEKFFYPGSIAALAYGETPSKFFSVIDTVTDKVEWIKLNTIHRQDISAVWTPTGIKADEAIHQDLLKGARVRANLRIEGGDNVDMAKAQLAEFLERCGALEYQINPQVIPVSKVRAVEITKAIKMSDKLKQYWLATEAPDEATQVDMLDKLAELEDECSL